MSTFKPFNKIARFNREVVITEKIDGTNALVFVGDDGVVLAGSRTRWVTVGNDNFGFAAWVAEHADELRGLGAGYHYGEWWGHKIQRGYGITERRFSLFNVKRWATERPACCHVVPVLASAPSLGDGASIEEALASLRVYGSAASPGFMKPEGIVIHHTASGALFKVTLEKDEKSKWEGP